MSTALHRFPTVSQFHPTISQVDTQEFPRKPPALYTRQAQHSHLQYLSEARPLMAACPDPLLTGSTSSREAHAHTALSTHTQAQPDTQACPPSPCTGTLSGSPHRNTPPDPRAEAHRPCKHKDRTSASCLPFYHFKRSSSCHLKKSVTVL